MKGISALVVLLACAVAAVSARRDHFSVCPSALPFPRNEDVVRRSPSIAAGCVEVQVPDQFIPFFVESPESLAIPALKDLVQVIPLPAFPSYYVVLAHESALLDLDMALLGTSKQIISAPKRRSPKRAPAEIPAFQKLAVKDDIINSLDGKVYYADLELLTGEKSFTLDGRQVTLKTRYTHTQSNLDAGTFIYQTFQSLGLTALYQPFRYSTRETRNIIGIKQGTTLANEVVVVGAHMDSISPDPNNLAPGCIDNGSGAEAVILMAKAFANYTSKRTIHFVLFGAEEQGLIGSNYYVDTLDETGYNVKYSLVMDMIGYSNNYFGVKLETSSSSANRNLADLMQDNTEAYGNGLTIARSTNYFGSDHVPFIDSGIPCFLAIEQDDTSYVGYHRTTDRINYLNVDQSIGITRGMAGTLYDLAY